jgi:hypothetical protein
MNQAAIFSRDDGRGEDGAAMARRFPPIRRVPGIPFLIPAKRRT